MKTTKALPVTLLTAALMAFAAGASGQEIVPITATLPIKAVGDSCTELNLGTTANPNLIAAEGVAITADRASLLTCQSGVWAKQQSNARVVQGAEADYLGRTTVGFDTNTNPATPCAPSVAYVNCRRISKVALGSLRLIMGNDAYTDSTWCDWQAGNVGRCGISGEIWLVYPTGVARAGYPVVPWAN